MATPAPDLHPLQAFQASLVTRHRLTQRAYLGTLRDFLAWLATQPGGNLFHIELLTQTAVQGYLDALKSRGAAPGPAPAPLRRCAGLGNGRSMKAICAAILRASLNGQRWWP